MSDVSVRNCFGRTISFRYIPAADGETYRAYSLTSARLYSSFPTDAQRANTATGHVEEITSWTCENPEGSGPAQYRIDFTAISDPSPTSGARFEKYYVALNFLAENGGPEIQDTELCALYRSDGLTGRIRVVAQDIYNLESTVETLSPTPLWVEAKIDAAIQEIEARLEALGYQKARLYNWDKLELSARLLATAYCCDDLGGQGSEVWLTKADRWRARYDQMFNSAKYGYDAAGTDDPDPSQTVTSGPVAFLR